MAYTTLLTSSLIAGDAPSTVERCLLDDAPGDAVSFLEQRVALFLLAVHGLHGLNRRVELIEVVPVVIPVGHDGTVTPVGRVAIVVGLRANGCVAQGCAGVRQWGPRAGGGSGLGGGGRRMLHGRRGTRARTACSGP